MTSQLCSFALSPSLTNSPNQRPLRICVVPSRPHFFVFHPRAASCRWSMSSQSSQEQLPRETPSHSTQSQQGEQSHLPQPHPSDGHRNHGVGANFGNINGNNNGNNNGSNAHRGEQPEGEDGHTIASARAHLTEATDQAQYQLHSFVKSPLATSLQFYQKARTAVVAWVATLMKTVPAPVLVAFISLFSTVSGARIKSRRDAQAAERSQIEKSRKRKSDFETMVREQYELLAAPMLKSSVKLAEMLHVLVDSQWEVAENNEVDRTVSPIYLAYLMGRFLATVEIIKEKSALLDYGFPPADRILGNILGRLQGILAANDTILVDMQKQEHLFKPEQGKKPLLGGPLRLTPCAQTVLGELMLRRIWQRKYDFVDPAQGSDLIAGSKAIIRYREFCQIFSEDETMRVWYTPVVRDFEKLKRAVREVPPEKRRTDKVGARVFFLQSCLLDLAEFYDPLPYPKFVPFSRRKRLRLGAVSYNEEQRSPLSLHKLYTELANIRDHKYICGDVSDRLRLPHGVEVFVSGAYETGGNKVRELKPGDCPYSHRVLITLQEMGVPYTAIPIVPDAKPGWYYLLHPQGRTPALYYDGEVVEESGHIVRYLRARFPAAKALASANHLKLAVGTASFTRFHYYFENWLKGNGEAKEQMEKELEKLNIVLERAQKQMKGKPFLGGSSFSREDTAIVPMLHNVEVAGRALQKWAMSKDLKAVWRYIEEARSVPSFARTVPKDSEIVEGYHRLSCQGRRPKWRFADLLE